MAEPRPNHLQDATSPYLQQHAYNPVDWYPWGPEALEKARREYKAAQESFDADAILAAQEALLDAKMKTSDWLRDIGASSDEEVVSEAQKDHARSAFKVMVTTPEQAKDALEKIETPAAVQGRRRQHRA